MPFVINISTVKSFLIYLFHWYLSYITTVPAVHHPTKLQYPYFELIFGDFAPAIIGSFFWKNIPQFLGDKPSRRIFRKALSRWYLAQYKWYLISFIIYWAILSFFLSFFLNFFFFKLIIKISSSLLYLAFKGHNISLSRRALFFPFQYIRCNSI